jgi:hypothetical protein
MSHLLLERITVSDDSAFTMVRSQKRSTFRNDRSTIRKKSPACTGVADHHPTCSMHLIGVRDGRRKRQKENKEKTRSVWKRTRTRSTQSRRQHWIDEREKKVLSIQIQQQSSSARFRQLSAIPVAGWERFFAFFDDAWE